MSDNVKSLMGLVICFFATFTVLQVCNVTSLSGKVLTVIIVPVIVTIFLSVVQKLSKEG